jgi:hypothetical protein
MAKYYGAIGFVDHQEETSPSVWTDIIVEHNYYGDVIEDGSRPEKGIDLNDDIRLDNMFSIIADGYALEKFFAIRYIAWMGAPWKVTDVKVKRPRLIISTGGVYNGQRPTT